MQCLPQDWLRLTKPKRKLRDGRTLQMRSNNTVSFARQFGLALEPFNFGLRGRFHGLFFALRFVSVCRPSWKKAAQQGGAWE